MVGTQWSCGSRLQRHWHSYNAIVPAFGIGTYLTGPAYSFKGTDVNIGVSSMDSVYNTKIYAQTTDESGNPITAYIPIVG